MLSPMFAQQAGPDGSELLPLLGVLVVVLVIAVIQIAAMWMTFSKAGQPGILSIIPIVNVYILTQIAGWSVLGFLGLFVPLLNIIFAILLHLDIAKRFGKGSLFGIGLLFLPFIFFPILGFGDARYLPNTTEKPWQPDRLSTDRSAGDRPADERYKP
jgi:hypothetical protein